MLYPREILPVRQAQHTLRPGPSSPANKSSDSPYSPLGFGY
jgi:hypothetical protein